MCPDDGAEQLRQVELHVDLVPGCAQAVEASVGDLFGDQDARHRWTIVTAGQALTQAG